MILQASNDVVLAMEFDADSNMLTLIQYTSLDEGKIMYSILSIKSKVQNDTCELIPKEGETGEVTSLAGMNPDLITAFFDYFPMSVMLNFLR